MTYFGFLALFLGVPIALLAFTAWRDFRRGRRLPGHFGNLPAWGSIAALVVIALTWTTPWDNYLVATRVWWYDPALVSGVVIGYVPVEEYTFFVLQPIMTGLWLALLMRALPAPQTAPASRAAARRIRIGAVGAAGAVWLLSALLLTDAWPRDTYLGLELIWALPPVMLQLGFGADMLWRYRRHVLLALLPPTLYLAAADAIAIGSGTWTINPEQSLELLVGGVLPVEEFLFFLLTNTLIVFGMTLAQAEASRARIPAALGGLFRRFNRAGEESAAA